MVKNLIFDTYFMKHFAFLACFAVLILFTAESAKVAKISIKCLVFNYNLH